jgi:ketosteroid isomerase-like protein
MSMPELAGVTENDAVLAADAARLHALIAADVDALERVLSDDLVFVHANGRQDDKHGYLAYCRSGHVHYRAIARREPTLKIAGDVAVLCAAADMDVTMNGEPRSATARYMSVWTKSAGAWKLLAIDMVRPPAQER